MLYHVYDLHRAVLSPLHLTATALRQVWNHPLHPLSYTRMGRAVAAGAELLERATTRYAKPELGLHHTTIDGQEVGVTTEVVWQKPFCDLLHLKRATTRNDPRLLVVAPLSGHYATLLRDTVAGLLPDHDVYITDWQDAAQVPMAQGRFDLDDYVDYLIEILRFLGPGTHVFAVCQPSVPVLGATAILTAANETCAPASMTLMGGPIDTRINPTSVNRMSHLRSPGWFEHTVITRVPAGYPGQGRRVFPGFLILTGFMSMNLDRHVSSHFDLFRHLVRGDGDSASAHRRFYDEFLSVMDLTAEFYLQTLEVAFIEHLLPRNRWISRGRPVDLRAIDRTALMTIEGEHDDISPPGQTRAAHTLCPNIPAELRHHRLQPGVGHFGTFSGKRWRGEVLPDMRDFIRRHD